MDRTSWPQPRIRRFDCVVVVVDDAGPHRVADQVAELPDSPLAHILGSVAAHDNGFLRSPARSPHALA